MGNKSDESRDSYNQIAFKYDTSKEGRYTAFHIEAVQTFVSDKQSLSDRYAGNDPLQIMSSGHRSYCFRQ